MATLTKEELRDRVLEHLGVKAAEQSATAADADLVDGVIDSAHDRLSRFGLVPFATSAIPEWAYVPLRDFVAVDVGPSFGKTYPRLPNGDSPEQEAAKRELARQVSADRPPLRVIAEYF